MSEPFNLNGLKDIYNAAYKRDEPTLAFELRDGKGRFIFMMFFSQDDDASKDRLFVFLGNTNTLLKFKTYGSHRQGDFKIYVNRFEEQAIRRELDIQGGAVRFDLPTLLQNLNSQIPHNLPLEKTIDVLRKEKAAFSEQSELRSLVDDAAKIYLIGTVRLPENKRPREKTLRKLYLHLNYSSNTVTEFIAALKMTNHTVAWTDDKLKANFDIQSMLRGINSFRTKKAADNRCSPR